MDSTGLLKSDLAPLRFAPSKVACHPFSDRTMGRDFQVYWRAEGPCNTRNNGFAKSSRRPKMDDNW
jgi:hypothetical protein